VDTADIPYGRRRWSRRWRSESCLLVLVSFLSDIPDIILQGRERETSGGNNACSTTWYCPFAQVDARVNRSASSSLTTKYRHGQECMLHEGSPVMKGTKYVLRSDLMFIR